MMMRDRYGEEVARLRQAQVLVKKAMDGSRKGVAAAVISDLKVSLPIHSLISF